MGAAPRGHSRPDIPSDGRKARVNRRGLFQLIGNAVEEVVPTDDPDPDDEVEHAEHFDAEIADPDESFEDFVARQNPSLLDFEHIPRCVDVANRVVTGEIKRLLVHEPPRYFKTETFSRLLTAHFLRQFTRAKAGIVSYGADLAWSISEEARSYFVADGGSLSQDTAAKKRWRTEKGGELWATGTGGPMIGFGFHLGVVDDPLDPERWSSPTYQRRFRSWWKNKFLNRQEPGARIVLVMQRLGLDDPFDYLFRREVGDEEDLAPENWHVLHLDEIHSDEKISVYTGEKGLPETCTLEPDPREVGDILAPSRFNRATVEHLQMTQSKLVASAQRQGRPMKPEGDFWKKDWFQEYDELPAEAHNGGWDWDLAYSKEEANSASAGVRTYRGVDRTDGDGNPIKGTFPIFVDDLEWDWLEFPDLITLIREKEGPHFLEAKASGKSAAQSLKREGITTREVQVEGDKLARATGVQPVVANERIFVNRRIKTKLLSGERQGLLRVRAEQLAASSGDLDVNDVFVQAIARHAGRPGRRVRAFTPSMVTSGNGSR